MGVDLLGGTSLKQIQEVLLWLTIKIKTKKDKILTKTHKKIHSTEILQSKNTINQTQIKNTILIKKDQIENNFLSNTPFFKGGISSRGNCKTTVPQKIDDFVASSQGQLAGLCRVDENMPEWAGEASKTTTWREMAAKGRFYGAHEFCNCLSILKI